MSVILLLLEQHQGVLAKKAAEALATAVKELKKLHGYQKAIALVIGEPGVSSAAEAATSLDFDEVQYLQLSSGSSYTSIFYEKIILEVMAATHAQTFLCVSTSLGKDLAPRIAAKLGAGQVSDVIEIREQGEFRRPMYAGNVIADVSIVTEKKVITIRGTAFSSSQTSSGTSPIKSISTNVAANDSQKVVSFETSPSERPELSDAEIVISGGRALQSKENFEKYLYPLADVLGASIGASRAAVDAGYAPNDWQVGQTGKVVAPKLYIAIGISGAIQHVAGMKDSKVIVAINKDAEAPIFEIADYGLVGDLYQIVPELIELLKSSKS